MKKRYIFRGNISLWLHAIEEAILIKYVFCQNKLNNKFGKHMMWRMQCQYVTKYIH